MKKLHPLPIVALTCVVSIGVSRAGDDNVAMKSGLPGIDPANPGVPTFAYYKPPYNLPRVPLRDVDVAHSTFKRGHGMSVGNEGVNGVLHVRAHDIAFLGWRLAAKEPRMAGTSPAVTAAIRRLPLSCGVTLSVTSGLTKVRL